MTLATQEHLPQQGVDEASSPNEQQVKFNDGNHELHVQRLYAWLHPDLQDLPGIDWAVTPSRIIGYLVNTVKDSPHAPHIALAIGSMLGAVGTPHLISCVSTLNLLLSFIRTYCNTWDGIHLTREVWAEFVTKMEKTTRRRDYLLAYSSASECHLPDYLERLDHTARTRIAPYVLPHLPARFLEQYGGSQEVTANQKRRRKEKSDVLVPLHSTLVALIQLRLHLAQRLLHAFRDVCKRAAFGEALPLPFSYEDTLPEINRDARTVAEVRLEKRTVVLEFKLWNRQTWIKHHSDEVSAVTRKLAEKRWMHYRSEHEQYFVEFLGAASDALWFGDLIANGVLMHLGGLQRRSRSKDLQERDQSRLLYAHSVHATKGFTLDRPGLLTPPGGFGIWLGRATERSQAILFDPESVYRACLFGAALTTIALTNGSRLTELLQISADRFKGHPYEEKMNGQTTGKQRVIWLQHLLPKGKKTEAERQLFPLSPQSYELLREIGTLLKETHGSIPVVRPHPTNTKAEDLKPERYLFQWQATTDGLSGALSGNDVRVLIRFMLHGLEFRTRQGEAFVVSTHLLRHVMATAARQDHEVPAEALAFILHHQQAGLTIPVATEYYSQMTEEQRLTALAEFMVDLEEQTAHILLSVPSTRTLSQMDEDIREVFERWHVFLETAFGFCGCVGLCPRGYTRNLCIGCPHLMPDPRKRGNAVNWRASYTKQAEKLEAAGELVDAHQARLQIQELDRHINEMDLLQQAIDDGTCKPVFLQLPSASEEAVIVDAET